MMKIKSKVAQSTINYGVISLILCGLIFLGMALFLPIESASIAEGVVVLDFNKKTIQHLEGGIIDQILVKEGQEVKKDDILLYLHDVKAQSEKKSVQDRLWTMHLQKSRLLAEKENKSSLNLKDFKQFLVENFPDLSELDKQKIKEITNNQIKLLISRRAKIFGEIKSLQEKIKSSTEKINIFKKELEMVKPLVAEGNLPLLKEMDLQKAIIDLKYEIDSGRQQIENQKSNYFAEIFKEIKETDVELTSLVNQSNASSDFLERSVIVAPVEGKIMNIKYHTIGAVIPPAGDIMNIVPNNEDLIIEAKIKPQDIDNINVDMQAKTMLTAYKGKKVPKINGKVINISPDIVFNEKTQESYFIARIAVDKKEIENLKTKVELYPGMPAQIFIINASRSIISYLFTPISDSAYKAFREE